MATAECFVASLRLATKAILIPFRVVVPRAIPAAVIELLASSCIDCLVIYDLPLLVRLLRHPVAMLGIASTPMVTASIFHVVLLRIHHFILTVRIVAIVATFARGRALQATALLRLCLITAIRGRVIVERL